MDFVSLHCKDSKLVGEELCMVFSDGQIKVKIDDQVFEFRTTGATTFSYHIGRRTFCNLSKFYDFVNKEGHLIQLQGYYLFSDVNGFSKKFNQLVKALIPKYQKQLELYHVKLECDRLASVDHELLVTAQEMTSLMDELYQKNLQFAIDRALDERDFDALQRLREQSQQTV